MGITTNRAVNFSISRWSLSDMSPDLAKSSFFKLRVWAPGHLYLIARGSISGLFKSPDFHSHAYIGTKDTLNRPAHAYTNMYNAACF